jgi:hypothetical protein
LSRIVLNKILSHIYEKAYVKSLLNRRQHFTKTAKNPTKMFGESSKFVSMKSKKHVLNYNIEGKNLWKKVMRKIWRRNRAFCAYTYTYMALFYSVRLFFELFGILA